MRGAGQDGGKVPEKPGAGRPQVRQNLAVPYRRRTTPGRLRRFGRWYGRGGGRTTAQAGLDGPARIRDTPPSQSTARSRNADSPGPSAPPLGAVRQRGGVHASVSRPACLGARPGIGGGTGRRGRRGGRRRAAPAGTGPRRGAGAGGRRARGGTR